MPNFFGKEIGRTNATLFEIRLDSDVIVLRGPDSEASSQLLRGVVVLCLPQALKIEDVHLRMTGTSKIAFTDRKMTNTGIATNHLEKVVEIFSHKFPPFVGGDESGKGSSSKGVTLPASNYEWPFELIIPGGTAESVEGLNESHIMYKLKATVARGRLAYDLHAYKPVRIIRTLDPAALELSHAMTVENVWPNKIEYSMVIPHKAIIFGTVIQIDMRFTSLLKGLKIGPIKCILVETQEFTFPGPSSQSHEKVHKMSRDIDQWMFEVNEEEHYHDIVNESGQDGYTISQALPLPKSLGKCMQDVDTNGIKIRHKVKFNIALHNPDGHTSELRATLPVTIFISPNMPLDESGNLLDQTPNSTLSLDIDAHAPPLYGEHILDQLYADIDISGIMTPAVQSGMSTPFYSQSRSGSHENISTMDGVASNAIRPDALSNRLQNLALTSRNSTLRRNQSGSGSGHNTPGDLSHSYGSNASISRAPGLASQGNHSRTSNSESASAPGSAPLSRRTSEEERSGVGVVSGMQTPEHIDFSNLQELSKVPSYTTAVRTPARGMSYSDAEALPNYITAVSVPPSPERGIRALATTPSSGGATTGSHGAGSYFSNNSDLAGQEISNAGIARHGVYNANGMAGLGLTPLRAGNGTQTNNLNGSGVGATQDADASRRVHLMQARGRAH